MAAASGLSLPDLEGFTDIRRLEITLQWLKQLPGSINKTNKVNYEVLTVDSYHATPTV